MLSTEDTEELLQIVQHLNEDGKINSQLQEYLKLKVLSDGQLESLMKQLSNLLFDLNYTCSVVKYCSKYILDLLSIHIFHSEHDSKCYKTHLINCVVLSSIAFSHPDVKRFILDYFEKYPAPFDDDVPDNISSKKRKIDQNYEINDLQVVKCCYTLLKLKSEFFRNKWSWSKFLEKYSNSSDDAVKWFFIQCVSILTGMNETQLNLLLEKNLTNEKITKFTIKYADFIKQSDYEPPKIPAKPSSSTDAQIIESKISNNLVSVTGISLPIFKKCNDPKKLVQVKSTRLNLRKVVLGIASGCAVCIQGPVGSGKTALVEYLASVTGRSFGDGFIKVQLGDQTDSKMLLGTYRCTDIPGEFVWQPGVLTKAVTDGSWLLLEDIDTASMDIATVITSLIENGSLSVPGFRDVVPVTSGFQLFVTQRLLPSITGFHKKHSSASSFLEKHMLQINVEPLTRDEMIDVVQTLFPQLTTIASRMVDVFLVFSSGNETESIISKSGRFTSTRDLFKWCSRAIIDFDVSSQSSALSVFQDALDIFCCSLPVVEDRLKLGKEICSKLGIVETKAEYFCESHKPNMSLSAQYFVAGRAKVGRDLILQMSRKSRFSFTRPSACLLERIVCCVNLNEPVLLVGETGTGKTSAVQYLSETIGQKLIVINMNQQSDSADLLGGYKPVDLKYVVGPVRMQFELLFRDYFSVQHNQKFLGHVAACFNGGKWGTLLSLMRHSQAAAAKRLAQPKEPKDAEYRDKWLQMGVKLNKLSVQLKQESALAFAFIEGSLVKAIQNGHWVLLDEINLASAETLECLSGLLEGSQGSLSLLERGDQTPLKRHPKFTLFACMNPSTDIGKKDLPAGLRNRFTEFFVEELTAKNDLLLLVDSYLKDLSLSPAKLESIVKFYLNIRKQAAMNLSDGLGHKPHYSLRTLCRALMIASKNHCGTVDRNLYEAFCLSFLTQLDMNSYRIVEQMIAKTIIGNVTNIKSILNQPIPEPRSTEPDLYVQFEGYWVSRGKLEPETPKEYVLTQSVRRNLKDLVRIVSIGRLPVLLQGDTSVGKTSLITYLAKSSGNKCVRINNHEHTDLQEYIGSYVADEDGKLVFREGVLVDAMREGHWIILDELNLAPTDVLEALNRVLDDNRELFIPETQETVKAHPNFMLFATQNPPGAYGGRKILSRAFRNRFVELHFNEIPPNELEIILHQRCEIPPSYCKKIIAVMTDLQVRRRGSAAFAGKQGFITLRDLFRWGERYRLAPKINELYDWDQHIADEGYLVLAGRVRKVEERNEIAEVLQKHIKRSIVPDNLFSLHKNTSTVTKKILEQIYDKKDLHKEIVWTFSMKQLIVLVEKALEFHEPVLLVGETGGGKTTVCRLIAENNDQQLVTVNCHMHTESSDFIGGLRPVRERNEENKNKLFEWVDGPLLQAMYSGNIFLADEISLADDSVLERLNSLLEPERSLLLAEKGSDLSATNSSFVVAHDRFHFIGTMNPGGDFGKKELSPALRNRFTEIWCESCNDRKDLIDIIEHNLKVGYSFGNQEDGSSGIGKSIIDFIEWFKSNEIGKRFTISIRDILTWVNFINCCSDSIDISETYIHGACLTFLDSFGSGVTAMESDNSLKKLRDDCTAFLVKQVNSHGLNPVLLNFDDLKIDITEKRFGIRPFFVQKGHHNMQMDLFSFYAPTTVFNTLRVLRGLQLNKAILLEGSPGVGKTSLVSALAKITHNKLLRINLSDQTDICDLFGSDLPVEGGQGGEFAWRDGPFLQALKNGDWIVLDELNLASQSVLEGLNACLDHRGEIFIPELGKTFHVKPGTRLFACQNPLRQGGSRRGLPKSFLNRFTQVYINSLLEADFLLILTSQFPIPTDTLQKMVEFNKTVVSDITSHKFGHKGSPWEFNLRDLTRWCEVMMKSDQLNSYDPAKYVGLVYMDRMRTPADKARISEIFESVFGHKITGDRCVPYVTRECLYMGDVKVERGFGDCDVNLNVLRQDRSCLVLRNQYDVMRSLMYCVNLNWMAILVGSSGSGKTKIVKTLSQLTGRELRTLSVNSAMDTTDILGGFEQADYNRHLEEVAGKVERLLLSVVQERLRAGDERAGAALLKRWEEFRMLQLKDKTIQTMADETKYFIDKLTNLKDFSQFLKRQKIPDTILDKLTPLELRLEKLTSDIEREETINAGGKFEWVDSILVKCLQDGCWLLIDNVNLCSPAVLDRLNALLEPNGVLTIGERGVDDQGDMVTIKPHPNFRLFLTMDPKNGEISRAMRNRGLEIYILSDSETGIRNIYDTKAIIRHNGLSYEPHQNILLKIHDFISENTLGEKPTISHLIQSSFLISQQLIRGINVNEAFLSTALDVYIKAKSLNEFNLNDPLNAVQSYVMSLFDTQIEMESNFCEATMKTLNLQTNSNYEMIKQQCALLQRIGGKDNPEYVFTITYNITSAQNLLLRKSYIAEKFIKNLDYSRTNEKIYQSIFEVIKNSGNLPIDPNWLPETIDKFGSNENSNQIFLMIYFIARNSLCAPIEFVEKKIAKLSVMQASQVITEKKISQFSMDHPLIVYFNTLLSKFDEFLLSSLKKNNFNLENDATITSLLLLNWRFVLQEIGNTTIYDSKNRNINLNDVISQLIVRYKWFVKNTVKYYGKFADGINSALFKIVDIINLSVENDLSNLKKIARRYIKGDVRPLPPTAQKQIELKSSYEECCVKASLHTENLKELEKRILLTTEIRTNISNLGRVLNTDYDASCEELQKINELINTKHSNTVKLEEIQLLPIKDVYGRILINNLRYLIINQSNIDAQTSELHRIITVPLQINPMLQSYNGDYHTLTKHITTYLINSASLQPTRYLKFKQIHEDDFTEVNISPYSTTLTYSVVNLCVSSELKQLLNTATLGSYESKSRQLKQLNELLWNNMPAFVSEPYNYMLNDIKYIKHSFNKFLAILEKSLTGNNSNNPENEILQSCINKINEIYLQNPESNEMLKSKTKFVDTLNGCYEEILKLNESTDNELILHTSNAFSLLNYLRTTLNTQLQVIDPLEKTVLKKKYCSEEKQICFDLKNVLEMQNEILSGKPNTVHPFCGILQRKIDEYQIREIELTKNIAYRPKNNMYQNLVKDVTHNINTLLSEESFMSIHKNMNDNILLLLDALKHKKLISIEKSNDSLNQAQNWLYSQNNALKKISVYQTSYPDITEPILSTLTDLAYGIKLQRSLLKKLLKQYEHVNFNLTTVVGNMVQFPVLNHTQESVTNLIDTCIITQNSLFNKTDNDDLVVKQEKLRMLKCAIQELYNWFVVTSPCCLDKKNEKLVLLHDLIDNFVTIWQNQETERQKKQEEEQSLYKSKTKCENLSEDEQALKEIKQLFPNHHNEDFSDLQQQLLDDPKEDLNLESDEVDVITFDDIKFIVDIHSDIMQTYTRNEWIGPKSRRLEPDFLNPLLQRYKSCAAILDNVIDSLDYRMDRDTIHGLNLLVYVSKCYGEGEKILDKDSGSPSKRREKNYNFYKDPKIDEVKTCVSILNDLGRRIKELLAEWPSHPTLQSIELVLERIYSFPLMSPLSRFLTGLEILLSKCNEWEENAHSGVSLADYSQNVTLQIINWRKLELAGWKECLNSAFDRVKDSVSKWWLHLYLSVYQFLSNETDTSVENITNVFKEFVEKSSLGEYESRVQLLYTFHCHVVNMRNTVKTDQLKSLLWNLYNYFNQFTSNVDAKIKELRNPIEKKLKDFVKIARWNDINYWSIKETVEKTHRTLHKYIKEFENVLKQPATACLVNTASESSGSESVGIWDRPLRHTPSHYHYSLVTSNYIVGTKFKRILADATEGDGGFSQQCEKYFNKSRTLCKVAISNTTYPNLIQNIDGFVSEIIETSNHLRNLEVSKDLPKNKQKSQAKSILQQKRKALSDLFKALTQCGLSYKVGLTELRLSKSEFSEFLLKPIDLQVSYEHIKNNGACDRQLLNVWDGCETYFLRSISRLAALENALKQPAQDLGMQNVERCRGFASHLMVLAQEQKGKLIESSRNLYYLRHYIHQLMEFDEECNFVNSDIVKTIIELLINTNISMEQYKIILMSCPREPQFGVDITDTILLDRNNCNIIQHKYDTNWNNCLSDIKSVVAKSNKLQTQIEKIKNILPTSDLNIETPKYYIIKDIDNIIQQLTDISDKTISIKNKFGDVPTNINWLSEKYKNTIELIRTQPEKIPTATHTELNSATENLINSILIVIQNVYKKYKTETETTEKKTEEEKEAFEENHLKTLIIENLFCDLSILEMKKVFRKVKKVAEGLFGLSAADLKLVKPSVTSCLPLLEQIALLYQYFVTQQTSAYRVTCKINSVLLNIFSELATKGFCVPPEFAEELEGEGDTKQSGGMGLGEGEGEKDVSDKIESEDQLEDAQPADQQKKNDDKDCKEEEKGIDMSEDFEGNLQDVDKPEDDESQSNSDSDAEKQMGDTEPNSDKLDQQIWGSDDENEDIEEGEEKNQNEERGEGGEMEDQQLSAKDDKPKPQNEEENEWDDEKEKKEQQKEVNEMEDKEYDDDQVDPYHGNQPQLPEPEPMDLPDDLQLDDGEEKEEQTEENPFDIDTMKEQMPAQPEEEPKEDEKLPETEEKPNESDSSDEEDDNGNPAETDKQEPEETEETEGTNEENQPNEPEGIQNKDENQEEDKEEEKENEDASAADNVQSNEDNIQAMDVDDTETADNVQANTNQSNTTQSDQISQEENKDKDGVGQSRTQESESGHQGQKNAADISSASKEQETQQEKRSRPGESDSNRSLAETTEPVKKKLKTIDIEEDTENNDEPTDNQSADVYQHIKEATENDIQTLDTATKEQADSQQIKDTDDKDDEITDKPVEMDVDEPDIDVTKAPKQEAEKTEGKSQKKSDGKPNEGDIVEEIKDVQVEGDLVDTMTVERGTESTYHTQYDVFAENQFDRLSVTQIQEMRNELEMQLGTWNEPPPCMEAEKTWEKFSAVTSNLARDLSEQLRLVLEPTQASRLRGDFRTGRRINMRKVIPYIASQFRKDKIWLRRTKPSKREYQIILAIDDSSSMDDNHSKELAFESVALISKALTLLESGQLSIVSFGEQTEIVHKLTDTFTEKSGMKLLQKFQFQQKKTCVANLVDFVTNMLGNTYTSALNAKLLIVVSDGRGIFSEGETFVQQAIRRAKFSDIFMVFVIIDNPENKNSILDIRMPVFSEGKLLGIKSYLDSFPFPFYIILRDINSLPSVLSDALRQWFELVTNVDKV